MIAINGRFLTQPLTGVQRHARQITAALAGIRDDVVIFAPPGADAVFAGLPVETVGGATGHRWEQVDLPRALRRRGSPLLLGLTNSAPLAYRNKVTTHHDVAYRRYPQSYSLAYRTFYAALTGPTLRSSRAVLTVSEFSKQEIAHVYGVNAEKIHVAPGAASAVFRAADVPRDEATVLAVGSVAVHKNFGALLAAWPLIRDRVPEAQLRLVGSALGVGEAVHLTESDGVSFLGRVSDDELVHLYQTATAYVMPSLYEGLGLPLLEAQACGCPVVGSNVASIPEVLQGSGVLIDPRSPESIAEGLVSLLRDPALRSSFAVKGRANAERFSWERSARLISGVLDGLL